MKTYQFSIKIYAPKKKVWQKMLSPESYREWTEAFVVGSYYEGSWKKGEEINFLHTNGNGTVGVIAENTPYEFISISHFGTVNNGVIDTQIPEAQAWTQTTENYSFSQIDGETLVNIEVTTRSEYHLGLEDEWSNALERLEMICEGDSHMSLGDV